MTEIIDFSGFSETADVLIGEELTLVVKSQDQAERRDRMIASRQNGRIGRIAPRPVAPGLVVSGTFGDGAFRPQITREFREPRHLVAAPNGTYLLTEMSRLLCLDQDLNIISAYGHPYFSFLHTVHANQAGNRILVVSSGFDCVVGLESDGDSFRESFRWMAWDHGFNPDADGCWLTDDESTLASYRAAGKTAALIRPSDYGEQGLLTERRSAHPNHACWDPYDDDRSFLVICGHNGQVSRISATETTQLATNQCFAVGTVMPHGLKPWNDGWVITDTLKGRWLELDRQFSLRREYHANTLTGKPPELGDAEWLQQIVPFDGRRILLLDANRGLIAVDLEARKLSRYQADPNWCIQDALFRRWP